MKLKISIQGGGSFFVPSFVAVMCRYPEVFTSAEVRLTDINQEQVTIIKSFCEQYVRVKNVPINFIVQPSLDASLDGADYVITTFRIGGLKSTFLDETIPPEFGYYGEETTGPGGMFMAMRTLPVLIDIARRMERLCPEAWLLNYANPSNYMADGVRRTTKTKIVSLCDGYANAWADVGACFGLHMDKIDDSRHAGLNHFGWAYRVMHKGRNLIEDLRRLDPVEAKRNYYGLERYGQGEDYTWYLDMGLEIFHLTGLYPCPLGHMAMYFFHDEFLKKQLSSSKKCLDKIVKRREDQLENLKCINREFNQKEVDVVANAHNGKHADLAIGVIASHAADASRLYPVNVPNRGAIQGLPPETIVEVYAVVDRYGIMPVSVPPFPKMVLGWLNLVATCQELVVQGIIDKNLHTVFEALALNPSTSSLWRARTLFKSMFEREREVLGPYWDGSSF